MQSGPDSARSIGLCLGFSFGSVFILGLGITLALASTYGQTPPVGAQARSAPSSNGFEKPTPLRLGGITQGDSLLTPRLHAYFRDIGQRIGRPIEIVDAPMKRLEQDVEDDKLDGFAYRLRYVEYRPVAKRLKRIPLSVMSARFAAYALDTGVGCLPSWRAIAEQPGRFSVMRGYSMLNLYLDSLGLRDRVVLVDSVGQAFNMLKGGRIRCIVESFDIMEARIRAGQAPTGMHYAGTLCELPAYIYVRDREAAWVPRIEAAVRALQQDPNHPGILPGEAPVANPMGCSMMFTQIGVP